MLKEVLKDLTDATADEHSQQAATSAGEELKSRHGTSQVDEMPMQEAAGQPSLFQTMVRVARQDRFHEARMKRAAKQQNRADQKELETGIDLIEAPVARLHREQQAQAEAEVQPMASIKRNHICCCRRLWFAWLSANLLSCRFSGLNLTKSQTTQITSIF
ncbi:TPA: hypothetical protein ACH3X3_009670 [Trebouxia sp. C0006]